MQLLAVEVVEAVLDRLGPAANHANHRWVLGIDFFGSHQLAQLGLERTLLGFDLVGSKDTHAITIGRKGV